MRFHEKQVKPHRRKRRRKREYDRLRRLETRAVDIPASAPARNFDLMQRHLKEYKEVTA